MEKHELTQYRQRLLDAGLPYRRVMRSVRELQDHHADLVQQHMARGVDEQSAREQARQQLGTVDQWVSAMQDCVERSLLHRHPVVMTIVLPPVLHLVASLLLLAVIVLPSVLLVGGSRLDAITQAAVGLQTWVLLPLAVCELIFVGVRNHLPRRYWITGMLLLCLFGSGLRVMLALPQTAPDHQGMLGVTFAYALHEDPTVGYTYLNKARLALNLLLCGLFAAWWHARERQQHGETDHG